MSHPSVAVDIPYHYILSISNNKSREPHIAFIYPNRMKYIRANLLFALLVIVVMMNAVFKGESNITKYYASGFDIKIPFLIEQVDNTTFTEQIVNDVTNTRTVDNTTLAQYTHAELSIIKHELPLMTA